MLKQCSKCKTCKPIDEFYRGSKWKDGRHPQCKACKSQAQSALRRQDRDRYRSYNRGYGKEYRKLNRDRERERHREWDREHPNYGRARKARAPINDLTTAQWKQIKLAYGYRCAYCGKTPDRLTKDHVVPLIKGGSHTASNIVPACLACNQSKGTNDPPPFLITPIAMGG